MALSNSCVISADAPRTAKQSRYTFHIFTEFEFFSSPLARMLSIKLLLRLARAGVPNSSASSSHYAHVDTAWLEFSHRVNLLNSKLTMKA